jgi:DNA primase
MKSAAFDSWIEKARAVRIENELARRGIKLEGRKKELGGPCPQCGGDDRFSINTEKQVFHSRNCNVGGDVTALVSHLDGCDFLAACEVLTGEPLPKPNGKDRGGAKKIVTAEFTYENEDGSVVFVVERVEYRNPDGTFVTKDAKKRKKTFQQKRPDPDRPGEWLWNVEGVTKVPYNLPALIEAVSMERVVFIVEGEGKVDALAKIGAIATCNAGGAGKWEAGLSSYLRGASVVLVPDNDDPGWKHVHEVGAALAGLAARTRVLRLPGLGPKGGY